MGGSAPRGALGDEAAVVLIAPYGMRVLYGGSAHERETGAPSLFSGRKGVVQGSTPYVATVRFDSPAGVRTEDLRSIRLEDLEPA